MTLEPRRDKTCVRRAVPCTPRPSTRSMPRPCSCFFPCPSAQPWGQRTPGGRDRPVALGGGRVAPATGLADGRRSALGGIGAERRQMPRAAPPLGILSQGPGLPLGPFADDARHDQRALGRHRRMGPHGPRLRARGCLTPRLLFFTKRQGSSHSKARGGTSRPRRSWKRSA